MPIYLIKLTELVCLSLRVVRNIDLQLENLELYLKSIDHKHERD